MKILQLETNKVLWEGANLHYADLHNAHLHNADLSYADLRNANLSYADLPGADLRYANLYNADLSGANLRNANLYNADLRNANLPATSVVLLATWGEVSPALCADLMMYDASCHPDKTAFDTWAGDGPCPYSNVKIQRACMFKEKKELWGSGKFRKPYTLMMRLFKEKNIQR